VTTPAFRRILLTFLFFATGLSLHAQSADSSGAAAHAFIEAKEWDKAADILGKLYPANPADVNIYHDYLTALLGQKDFRAAEQLVNEQKNHSSTPTIFIDLGRVYEASGKTGKATAQYDAAIKSVNGDEMLAQQLVAAFSAAGHDDYAIQVYERMRTIMQNPFLYSGPLSRLYARIGDVPNAIEALLHGGPTPFGGQDDTKSQLLELLGNDAAKLGIAQKAIIRRINLQPENTYYADLLTWLYTQKGDWEGALLQIQAIDERTNAGGQGLLQFAQQAEKEEQYDIALKSLEAVVEMGNAKPYYSLAKAQRLTMSMHRLKANPSFTKEDVAALEKDYAAFFTEFPQFEATEVARDYAELEAQFNGNPQKAIEILERAIAQPTAAREFIGRAKLQLGDYLLLDGRIWDASLIYSQVDKAFREDYLGEDARYRNARLAYYRGDFGWAQTQLSVLKASTSELIANDALYLSVLITENTPDSNTAALLLFSKADLLLFQNKNAEALKVLDSITSIYPKHPLQDDVLMLRATLAQRQHDYNKAIEYLAFIIKDYGKDVLGDDAVFKTAGIYDRALKNPEKAKEFYEQLIMDYPGSTYVQIARNRLAALNAATHL
jgi:TolA-binding protein